MSKLFECSVFLNRRNVFGELVERTEVARVRNKNYAEILIETLTSNFDDFHDRYYKYTIEER